MLILQGEMCLEQALALSTYIHTSGSVVSDSLRPHGQ